MNQTKEDVLKRIERYLRRNDSHPRVVNVNNADDLSFLCQYFDIENHVFKTVSDFSAPDENMSEDRLYDYLGKAAGNVFLTGFTSYYRLLGEEKLQTFIHEMLGRSLSGLHLVLLCYQCEKYLEKEETRYQQFIYRVEGQKTECPQLVFSPMAIPIKGNVTIEGVQAVAECIENNSPSSVVVHTKKQKASYPLSLYAIKDIRGSYDILCSMDVSTERLKESYGTEEEWHDALTQMAEYGSWMKYISAVFGTTTNLEFSIGSWGTFDAGKKWLYFIALKLYANHSWCLSEAVKNTDSSARLVRGIFRSILSLSPKDDKFWIHYEERKHLIRALGNPDAEVTDYCAMAKSKGENILYYLTDATKMEQNLIFESLSTYSEKKSRSEVEKILEHIYPALSSYLKPYRFNIPLLDEYFQEYKYQKVVNKVFPEFLNLVNEQAEKREYNLLLPSRSEKLDAIEKDGTVVYFMDAMGAEYLSYILEKCHLCHLMAYVSVCHCELPSITCFNKRVYRSVQKRRCRLCAQQQWDQKS